MIAFFGSPDPNCSGANRKWQALRGTRHGRGDEGRYGDISYMGRGKCIGLSMYYKLRMCVTSNLHLVLLPLLL
jgi:hypothetical protein